MLASHHGFGCELDTHIEEFSPLSTRQFSAGYGSGFEDGEKSEDSLAFDIAISGSSTSTHSPMSNQVQVNLKKLQNSSRSLPMPHLVL